MTRKPDIYNILGWLAMIAVPVSPAMFFGWKAYDALMVLTATGWLAVPGGVLTAFGLETVGIFAGHTAIDAYRRNDRRWKLAALIMLVYVVIGTLELWSNSIGRVTFIIAALVYLLAGLRHDLEETATAEQITAQKQEKEERLGRERKEADEKAERDRREAWELEQAAKDREVERQLKLQAEADRTAVQMARIQAKKEQPVSSDDVSWKPEETEGNKKETMKQLWKPGMKPTELAALAGVSKGYASKYINNGAMKHYQERA